MRTRILRRVTGGRITSAVLAGQRRETDDTKLAVTMKAIVEEGGDRAALLLGLIEKRAPGITALETADFVLGAWREGGEARDRILAHALKSADEIRIERELAVEVREILRPLAGEAFSVDRLRDVRSSVVKMLRSKLPNEPIATLTGAAKEAIDFRADRLVVRMDGIVALLVPRRLAS